MFWPRYAITPHPPRMCSRSGPQGPRTRSEGPAHVGSTRFWETEGLVYWTPSGQSLRDGVGGFAVRPGMAMMLCSEGTHGGGEHVGGDVTARRGGGVCDSTARGGM